MGYFKQTASNKIHKTSVMRRLWAANDAARMFPADDGLSDSLSLSPLSSARPLKEDEVMPAKFEDDLIWVAADTPLTDSAFLSNKIKDLCGELPIFWLRPTYSSGRQTGGALSRRYGNVESEEARRVVVVFFPSFFLSF